jgi:hypothetical protein
MNKRKKLRKELTDLNVRPSKWLKQKLRSVAINPIIVAIPKTSSSGLSQINDALNYIKKKS